MKKAVFGHFRPETASFLCIKDSVEIDLIITKSVSRFARNIVDCVTIVRMLNAMRPPVGIFFETENIFTLKDNSEMSLNFTATMAQEESHVKSSIMNASIEMRFSHGIVLTPVLLGYDHDEAGHLTINDDEAKIVRLIFFLYLFGYTCQEIADKLTEIGCETKRGNTVWNPGSILQILRNERYCGDVLTRKTYTPSYLDHKSRKNMGDRTQHRWKDLHDPIITRDDFIAVQQLINNAKYGNKGILPELHVIKEGALKGFVPVHPRWGGFREEHYINACMSAFADDETIDSPGEQQIIAQGGDFDFRGFEIARSQFFDVKNKPSATFSIDSLTFSTACIRKLNNCLYVELLVHPVQHFLAVRPIKKGARNAIQWAKLTDDGAYVPRQIAGAAFLNTIFSLFEWDQTFKYRICGVRKKQGDDAVLMFDLQDTEVFMPENQIQITEEQAPELDGQAWLTTARKSVIGYPSDWADSFGMSFYRHAQARELTVFLEDGTWQIAEQAQPFEDAKLTVTGRAELQQGIQQLMREIRQDAKQEDITDGS